MIYIRVDMNGRIATGHLMRCLSIAEAAQQYGESTTFLVADQCPKQLIEDKGFQCIVLDTAWDKMDEEIEKISSIIKNLNIPRLLVDSYQVTETYLRTLSKITDVTYIDDLNQLFCPVKTLICYTIYSNRFNYKIKYPNTNLMLGTQFVPLRPEFRHLGKKDIRPNIERILLMSGGTDALNMVQRVLDELVDLKSVTIDAICGIYSPYFAELNERYSLNKNIVIHRATNDIISYMMNADVAISAGGTTLYELCAVGTPTISYTIADNQLDNVKCFADKNLIEYAGDARTEGVERTIKRLLLKYNNATYRECVSKRMQSVVDGNGAYRIAKYLICSNDNC